MASPVPAKSQPLHNFSLPQLKWKKNHTSNLHRGHRLTDSPPRCHQSPLLYSAPKQSPIQESASDSESGFVSDYKKISAFEDIKNSVSVSASDNLIEKSQKDKKSKIYFRLRKSKVTESVQDENNQENGITIVENHEIVEPKTWNLRPRKPLLKPSTGNNGGTIRIQENKAENKARPQLDANNNTDEKKDKKQKFSITLSGEEIEDDILVMTGSKPLRKPKKRAKIVQKQLDNLFPGMWLSSITPDCYKVPEAPLQG